MTRTEYEVAGQDYLYFSPKGSCSSYSIILVDNALKLDPTHFFPSGPACTSRGCALEEAHGFCEDLDSRSSLGARVSARCLRVRAARCVSYVPNRGNERKLCRHDEPSGAIPKKKKKNL